MGKWFIKWFGWLFGKKQTSKENPETISPDSDSPTEPIDASTEPIDPVPTAPEVDSTPPSESPIEAEATETPHTPTPAEIPTSPSTTSWELDVPESQSPEVTPEPQPEEPIGDTPAIPPATPISPSPTPEPPQPVFDPFEDSTAGIEVSPEEVLQISIQRYSFGQADTLGRLLINGRFCCFTLEGVSAQSAGKDLQCIPAGKYPLALRKTGGKHATYYFRHQGIHKGMLWIQQVPEFEYAQIHEGNSFTDVPGSIIVGEQPLRENQLEEKRELWYSEHAYLEIYPLIANHLSEGGKAVLSIS